MTHHWLRNYPGKAKAKTSAHTDRCATTRRTHALTRTRTHLPARTRARHQTHKHPAPPSPRTPASGPLPLPLRPLQRSGIRNVWDSAPLLSSSCSMVLGPQPHHRQVPTQTQSWQRCWMAPAVAASRAPAHTRTRARIAANTCCQRMLRPGFTCCFGCLVCTCEQGGGIDESNLHPGNNAGISS